MKRLDWAKQFLHEAEHGFDNVIWTDECTIQLQTHRRFCFRKIGEAPKPNPRYVIVIDSGPILATFPY